MNSILLVGSNKLTFSIALCILKAKQKVILLTSQKQEVLDYLIFHTDSQLHLYSGDLDIVSDYDFEDKIKIAIAITNESLLDKQVAIKALESYLPKNITIAINTETIPIKELQSDSVVPARIIGLNWVEPAFNTYFLEIIANEISHTYHVDALFKLAKEQWNKDPYLIKGETGVRMRLKAAMIREGLFLVENGYASIEDVDRACRNDAGYYLPFAGNLRYMDLMGTYAYGMVMKDLNLELAKDTSIPDDFNSLIENNHLGMQSGQGFYNYSPGENQKWEILMKKFSSEVVKLFEKYPFNYEHKEE